MHTKSVCPQMEVRGEDIPGRYARAQLDRWGWHVFALLQDDPGCLSLSRPLTPWALPAEVELAK